MSNKKSVETAVETEAKGLDVEFEYEGETYVFPPARKWPLEVIEAQENMKLMKFTKELLGEDQFATLRKTVKTVGDLDDFITKLFEKLDVDKGK